jgi:hypothetical protein
LQTKQDKSMQTKQDFDSRLERLEQNRSHFFLCLAWTRPRTRRIASLASKHMVRIPSSASSCAQAAPTGLPPQNTRPESGFITAISAWHNRASLRWTASRRRTSGSLWLWASTTAIWWTHTLGAIAAPFLFPVPIPRSLLTAMAVLSPSVRLPRQLYRR